MSISTIFVLSCSRNTLIRLSCQEVDKRETTTVDTKPVGYWILVFFPVLFVACEPHHELFLTLTESFLRLNLDQNRLHPPTTTQQHPRLLTTGRTAQRNVFLETFQVRNKP